MQRSLFAILLILAGHTPLFAQEWSQFAFNNGDLVFQDLDCGDLCDAIEAVTPGVQKKHFSHVGLVYLTGDSAFVIEAIKDDVHLTPIREFMNRQLDSTGRPKVVVGRVKSEYKQLLPRATGFAVEKRGVPYDPFFRYNNGLYYCSELIYDAFLEANHHRPFFRLQPMTYKRKGTGRTYNAWTRYFKQLNAKIPEGKPGCNPGSLATSDKLEIVKSFY